MRLKPMYAELLAARIIPNADPELASQFNLSSHQRSIAMFTVTLDDVGSTALDEATKRADVDVAYARSFYAGADHASGPLSGEFIGVLAGPTPDEVRSGLEAAIQTIEQDVYFEALNEEKTHCLFAHVIASTGTFLSKEAGVKQGEPLAYLIAPPLESIYGLDAALKAAEVKLMTYYGPPSETNFGGGLLTGTQSACVAAAEAFRDAVIEAGSSPVKY